MTPEFLRGLAGELALECRAKDVAIAQLERQLSSARAERATARAKLAAVSEFRPGHDGDGGEG